MVWFILFMIAMAAVQGSRLYMRRMRQELAAFAATWAVALAYGIVTLAGVKIPKPIEVIASLFERLY
jgi:hypothetical protein